MLKGYEAVIGLEVHAQLLSNAKMFCMDPAVYGAEPNTLVSPISLGHPGTLPVVNRTCIEHAIKIGLATTCSIRPLNYFARKNYFYPDLPKGYQISQDKTPICFEGVVNIILKDNTRKSIGITRIHIEEDSGKSIHDQDIFNTLIDLNRAGTGLIEIVSEPDIRNSEEAMAYLTEIRKLVRHLEICDGNMEEGSLRCDANISVSKAGSGKWGTKVEVKNMNSISNVGRAINFEIERQINLLEEGQKVIQQTRTWDSSKGITLAMRDKESSHDYRYFPEPDILPLQITQQEIDLVKAQLPELPEKMLERFVEILGLPYADAFLLAEQKALAAYFSSVLKVTNEPKPTANWILGPVKAYLNEHAIDIKEFRLEPEKLAKLILLVQSKKVSLTVAKEKLFDLLIAFPESDPETLAGENRLLLEDDSDKLVLIGNRIIEQFPDKVAAYKSGKTGLLGFFVGKLMQETGGTSDPKQVNAVMTELLNISK